MRIIKVGDLCGLGEYCKLFFLFRGNLMNSYKINFVYFSEIVIFVHSISNRFFNIYYKKYCVTEYF